MREFIRLGKNTTLHIAVWINENQILLGAEVQLGWHMFETRDLFFRLMINLGLVGGKIDFSVRDPVELVRRARQKRRLKLITEA